MEKPMISVVVPVYNAQDYLPDCIKSIQNQSFTDWELILADDGSKDRSGKICDEYAARDSRIRVIHKANGGAADTRNRGAALARGQYVAFVDADDYLAENYLAYLLSLLETGADAACCDSFWTDSRSVDFSLQEEPAVRLLDRRKAVLALTEDDYLKLVTPWGKLFPTERVRRFPFPTGRKVEDEATLYKLLYDGKTLAMGNQKLYGYYQNAQGLMHQLDEKHIRDSELTMRERYEYFRDRKEPELADRMLACYLNSLITWAVQGQPVGKPQLKQYRIADVCRLQVRPLYKMNFICWKVLRIDLITTIDRLRGR